MFKYDTENFALDIFAVDNSDFTHRLNAELNGRVGERFVRIEYKQTQDWKIYLCVAGVGSVAGGYIVYKLLKK